MEIYIIAVIIMIILTSAVLAVILYKNRLFNLRIFAAVIASSVIVCILFPLTFNAVTGISGFMLEGMGIFLAFILTLLIYIFIVFLLSMAVMSFSNRASKNKENGILIVEKMKKIFQRSVNRENFVDSGRNIDKMGLDTLPQEAIKAPDNPTDIEICNVEAAAEDTGMYASNRIPDAGSETAAIAWPYSEELDIPDTLVDGTAEAKDPESGFTDGEEILAGALELTGLEIEMSLDDCINEAFRLKTAGDLEGAIIYYMYALDSNPDRDLVFLLILDICTLYKTLGQVELAREILESYFNSYSDLMEHSVRSEIERNLQDM